MGLPADLHTGHGVRLRLGAPVTGLTDDGGRVAGVRSGGRSAVDELLRYLTITHGGRRRVVLEDMEVAGVNCGSRSTSRTSRSSTTASSTASTNCR